LRTFLAAARKCIPARLNNCKVSFGNTHELQVLADAIAASGHVLADVDGVRQYRIKKGGECRGALLLTFVTAAHSRNNALDTGIHVSGGVHVKLEPVAMEVQDMLPGMPILMAKRAREEPEDGRRAGRGAP
jgi:hypothetical protein